MTGTRRALSICPILLLLRLAARAQTGCEIEHVHPGAFICYPNPAEHTEDATLGDVFHLSAQANAPAGRMIRRYVVWMDGHRIFENRLAQPTERLSIETNLKSPFHSGSHTLSVSVDGAGVARIAGLTFQPSSKVGFCDPFSRVDARTCLTSNSRGPLQWSIAGAVGDTSHAKGSPRDEPVFAGYAEYLRLYGRNLTALEADVADAVAVESPGDLYMASHSATGIELRKYAPDSSLTYDRLVPFCGGGFISIAAIAVRRGRVWMAGNTTACPPTTTNAVEPRTSEPGRPHGFVMLIDTTKSGSDALVFVTYLSRVESQINALRVDEADNAYLCGMTTSEGFPQASVVSLSESAASRRSTSIGFVSMMNPSGSALQWSTLLPGARLQGIAIDGSGTVFVTGRRASPRSDAAPDGVLVAALSDNGRHLAYAAFLDGKGEGRAISITTPGHWVLVAGAVEQGRRPIPFVLALQPCRTGIVRTQLFTDDDLAATPDIAVHPALDAFATDFPKTVAPVASSDNLKKPPLTVGAASNCQPVTP